MMNAGGGRWGARAHRRHLTPGHWAKAMYRIYAHCGVRASLLGVGMPVLRPRLWPYFIKHLSLVTFLNLPVPYRVQKQAQKYISHILGRIADQECAKWVEPELVGRYRYMH